MTRTIAPLLGAALCAALASAAFAQSTETAPRATSEDAGPMLETAAPYPLPEAVSEALNQVFGRAVEPTLVRPSPVGEGLIEMLVNNNVYYFSADGKYFLTGQFYDIATRDNLTEALKFQANRAELEKLDPDSLIVFSPEAQPATHSVTVFTDTDCGYCARLHAQMDDYLARGIEIRYAAFPRAGVGSGTYDTMVSVWCADDPHTAMTDAKARRPVEPKTCENPVAKHFEIGSRFGVRGTPTLILSDGEVVPGYLPPDKLIENLERGG